MIANNGRTLTENEVWNNDDIMAINADIGLSMHQLMLLVRAIEVARPVEPAFGPAVTLDFKQATEFLEMFGDEPTEICLIHAYGHSGDGIYAFYNDMPEEGTIYLGVSDDEAIPDDRTIITHQVPKVAVDPTTTANYELVAAFSGFYGGQPVINVLNPAMILPTGASLYWRISTPKEST